MCVVHILTWAGCGALENGSVYPRAELEVIEGGRGFLCWSSCRMRSS